MPIADYYDEIEAKVSYAVYTSCFTDEPQGEITDCEIHDLWLFGRNWTMGELIETFGEKGARAIERFILDRTEYWE